MSIPDPGCSLCVTPTPIQRLERLSADTGADCYVKRDDMTGGPVQGNKVRKLEYLLADALEQGADAVITCGGIQSNHCRTTAVTARQVGLEPHLLLNGDAPDVYDGNRLLDGIVGANVEYVSDEQYSEHREAMFAAAADRVSESGKTPYVIPAGGSDGLGILGYVRAYQEIVDADGPNALVDRDDGGTTAFDRIYTPVGSGGTYAGLLAGALLADHDVEIVGIAVSTYSTEEITGTVRDCLADCERRVEGVSFDLDRATDRVSIVQGYTGPGYAEPSTADLDTIVRAGREEGLVLDTCYTGKAFRGFVEQVEPGETALFVHTGGSFGMFPLRERLTEACSRDAY